MSFRTHVRNLTVLNILQKRFLASLRNDTKTTCDTFWIRSGSDRLGIIRGTLMYKISSENIIQSIPEKKGFFALESFKTSKSTFNS